MPVSDFESLFRSEYAGLVAASKRLCGTRAEAEDIVQNVFVRLHEQGRLPGLDNPPAYLRRAVVTRTLNAIRDRRRVDLPGDEALWSAAEQFAEPEAPHLSDLKENLERAIAMLPERARLILQLSKFEGLSHKEIAESMGIAPKTVENQLARSLKLLRKYLPTASWAAVVVNSLSL